MKKYIILTSVLALAACGGGSGGSSAGTELSAFDRAAESNKNITSMVSSVSGNSEAGDIAAASVRAPSNAKAGNVFFLDNVTFESADKEMSDEPNRDFSFKFEVDKDGKIIAINTTDDGDVGVLFERHGDENRFDFKDEDGDGFAVLHLLGKDINQGLKYSDFGFFELYTEANPDKPMFILPIAGGYEVKHVTIDKDALSDDVVFHGTAVAGVGEISTAIEGDRLVLTDKKATLTFDKKTGDETLAAKFDKWYDVTATLYNDGYARIKFATQNTIADEFRIRDANGAPTNNYDSGKIKNKVDENGLSIDFDHYGNSANNPTEATGIIYYGRDDNDPGFFMGFGGTK